MPSVDGINPVNIAGAVSGLRFDTIKSLKWEIRPSVGIVAKDIDRLAMDIKSFKQPLTSVVKMVMIPSIKKNFKVGGRPSWDPLAENTIIARNYSAWPILVRTGRLQRRATEFGIWDIGQTSATIRSLPDDVFYGAYHQAGADHGENPASGVGDLLREELALGHKFKDISKASPQLRKIIGKFIPHAQKELGEGASNQKIVARALGMAVDAEGTQWSLPARPFITYQDSDVDKATQIFLDWMTERAIKSGRFTDLG